MEGKRVCQISNRCFANGKAMARSLEIPLRQDSPSQPHLNSLFLFLFLFTPSPHISTQPTPESSSDPPLPFVKDSNPPSQNVLESNITEPGSENHEIDNKQSRESPDEIVESPIEPGQGSLAAHITFSDKEGAMCLMMLSRDICPSDESEAGESQDYRDSDDREDDESIRRIGARAMNKGRFKSETCNKVFGSYQALGGHRASHKKVKLHRKKDELLEDGGGDIYGSAGNANGNNDDSCSHKIFECPYCGKVFQSGQALGGHRKVHVQLSCDSHNCSAAASSGKCKVTGKLRRSRLIDLNQLPHPETNNEESKPFYCIERRIF